MRSSIENGLINNHPAIQPSTHPVEAVSNFVAVHATKLHIIIIFLFLLLSFVGVESNNNSARREIDVKREQLRDVQEEKVNLVEQLDNHDRQIENLRGTISKLEAEEKSLVHSHEKMLKIKDQLEGEYLESKEELELILVETYKRGKASELQFLFGADDFVDLFQRYKLLSTLAGNRSETFNVVDDKYQKYCRLIEELEKKKAKIEQNRETRQNELASLSRNKREYKQVLEDLSDQEREYKEAIWVLQKSINKLENEVLINPKFEGKFGHLKGVLPWPVRSRKVMYKFGKVFEKKHGTVFVNSGIDIEATADEEIKAVAEGEIAHVGWLRGFEYVVVIRHGEGYFSLYGNMGKVNVENGAYVGNGEVLGYVSSQGWTEGPKIHFEIRKGKDKENPLEWLRST